MSSWSLRVNPLAASSLSKKPEDFVMEENVGLEFDSKSDSDPSSLSSSSSSSWPDKLNLDKVNGQTLVRWWDNLTWCKRIQEIRTKSCFSLYKDINTVRKIYGCLFSRICSFITTIYAKKFDHLNEKKMIDGCCCSQCKIKLTKLHSVGIRMIYISLLEIRQRQNHIFDMNKTTYLCETATRACWNPEWYGPSLCSFLAGIGHVSPSKRITYVQSICQKQSHVNNKSQTLPTWFQPQNLKVLR